MGQACDGCACLLQNTMVDTDLIIAVCFPHVDFTGRNANCIVVRAVVDGQFIWLCDLIQINGIQDTVILRDHDSITVIRQMQEGQNPAANESNRGK